VLPSSALFTADTLPLFKKWLNWTTCKLLGLKGLNRNS
jgi:hypothetical protein